MSKEPRTTLSLYVPTAMLQRIDEAAEREAVSRNQYILGWLPENYDQPTDPHSKTPATNGSTPHR